MAAGVRNSLGISDASRTGHRILPVQSSLAWPDRNRTDRQAASRSSRTTRKAGWSTCIKASRGTPGLSDRAGSSRQCRYRKMTVHIRTPAQARLTGDCRSRYAATTSWETRSMVGSPACEETSIQAPTMSGGWFLPTADRLWGTSGRNSVMFESLGRFRATGFSSG